MILTSRYAVGVVAVRECYAFTNSGHFLAGFKRGEKTCNSENLEK